MMLYILPFTLRKQNLLPVVPRHNTTRNKNTGRKMTNMKDEGDWKMKLERNYSNNNLHSNGHLYLNTCKRLYEYAFAWITFMHAWLFGSLNFMTLHFWKWCDVKPLFHVYSSGILRILQACNLSDATLSIWYRA